MPRTPLPGDRRTDVAIVGAGYTGLWTAWYLHRLDPALTITVLEAEVAGYGASGRNGGWCSALFPASLDALARLRGSSREAALRLDAAMRDSVDEVGRAADEAGIDARYAKGGTLVLARSEVQRRRARASVEEAASWGLQEHLRWLDEDEARGRLDAVDTCGATYTPDCAALHPARLVRGLARALDDCPGVTVHERTRALAIEPHQVRTERGTVTADVVVRATEGYTPTLEGHQRTLMPVHSLVVATEPLSHSTWERIGLRERETFSDHRHLVVYGQRTSDDRLVFGGRGAPYTYGSRVRPEDDVVPRVFLGLRNTLREMFPVLERTQVTHAWGGVLGIPRDWTASVGLDRGTGLAWAGGYVGDGVGTSNLAGRTLADLITGRETDLVDLPWVGHRSPRWEPEPLRWLGVNAGLRAMTAADREEQMTGRGSRLARLMAPLTGGH